ncbi:MAG: sigma-70 family RNA polymerase sigma factor [Rhodopirellula sp. JB044]|uniref:sigma-70 family RNA polymerase sigma factor n=1 Tax=Rhodopirellula sp. JB044 TaxID=3342844 RepID=UPI00370BFD98
MSLFDASHRVIRLYLRSLLPTQNDVEDVFQETSLVMWREFDRFEAGTNFGAWACSIAFNQVRAWRTRQQRERLRFSDDMTEMLSDEFIEHSDHYDDFIRALDRCMERLPSHQRLLIDKRCRQEMPFEAIAADVQRPEASVRAIVSRVRKSLRDCVNRKMNRNP